MALTDEQIETEWDSRKDKLKGWDYGGAEVMYEGAFNEAARAIESAACAERDARIAELERQLAEARKDAERIDWLSSSKSSHGFCHTMYGEYLFYAHQLDGFPTVREVIDNAMKEQT